MDRAQPSFPREVRAQHTGKLRLPEAAPRWRTGAWGTGLPQSWDPSAAPHASFPRHSPSLPTRGSFVLPACPSTPSAWLRPRVIPSGFLVPQPSLGLVAPTLAHVHTSACMGSRGHTRAHTQLQSCARGDATLECSHTHNTHSHVCTRRHTRVPTPAHHTSHRCAHTWTTGVSVHTRKLIHRNAHTGALF